MSTETLRDLGQTAEWGREGIYVTAQKTSAAFVLFESSTRYNEMKLKRT